ncbi:MAG: hypothetical protein CL927_03355 [Deltaproteobacteria bacterium]|nr:hypothetical protein [Deltaproteobacteria bacterium]HCH63204.1 hypothetical protein [Deltaproteobacteria bacterium]
MNRTISWMVKAATLLLCSCVPQSSKDDSAARDSTAPAGPETPLTEGSRAGECSDGADNDGDGEFDCFDSDCAGAPACSEVNMPGGCVDGTDNDGDGLIDCDDPDCAEADACDGGSGSSGGDDSGGSSGGGASDSGDDTGSTGAGDGTGEDATGLVSGYVEHNFFAIGCPSCFGFSDATLIESSAALHAPTAGSWRSWFPPIDTCVVDPTRTPLVASTDDLGGSVALSAGSITRQLARTTNGTLTTYAASSSDDGSFAQNTTYDLSAPDATPSLTISSVLQTIPTGFTAIEPLSMFSDIDSAFQAFSASSADFSWAPAGTADGVAITIQVYDSYDTTYQGEVFCFVSDSGTFQVPVSSFAAFFEGDLAAIYVSKVMLSEAINPTDGSTVEGMSVFGGIGTATLYP